MRISFFTLFFVVIYTQVINDNGNSMHVFVVFCNKREYEHQQSFEHHIDQEAEMKSVLVEWYGPNPEESTSMSRIINAKSFARVDALLSHGETAKCIVHGGQRNEFKL